MTAILDASPAPDTVVLKKLNIRDYRNLVVRSSPDDTALWAILTGPLAARTAYALRYLRGSLATQLADRRAILNELHSAWTTTGTSADRDAWETADRAYRVWHPRALKYRQVLSKRIAEYEATTGRPVADRHLHRGLANTDTLLTLAAAILTHKQAAGQDIDPEPYDETLWAALDECVVETETGTVPVAGLLC